MPKIDKNISLGLTFCAIVLLILWLATENRKKKRIIEELEIDRLKLIKDSIENSDQVPSEIKEQLNSLINEYKNIDPEISAELITALSIINAGEEEKGIGCLSIIIEKMLKARYAKHPDFTDWLKKEKRKSASRASQADLIEYQR